MIATRHDRDADTAPLGDDMGSPQRFEAGTILRLGTLLTVVACGGGVAEPTTPPTTGRVTVATATRGAGFDADGYVATIDGSGPRPVGVQDTIDVTKVAPADHTVELDDVASNCMLDSANPVDIVVTAGSAATAAFDVHCVPELVSRIAFTSMRDGNEGIYLMAPDGSDPINWTHDPTAESGASISPDGLAIAFMSTTTGDPEIWAAYVDGTGLIRLTDASGFDGTPSWSPDGSKIAFMSEREGNKEIYVMHANGSGQVNISHRPLSEEGGPHWSPDGRWIAFHSDRTGTCQLFTMHSDARPRRSSRTILSELRIRPGRRLATRSRITLWAIARASVRIYASYRRTAPTQRGSPTSAPATTGPPLVAGRHADRVHSDRTGDDEVWVIERRRLAPGQRHQSSGRRRALWTAQAWSR
jgi:hypothetical protein